MSIPTTSPASLTLQELHARVKNLDSEVLLLRSQLEEQSWRMAQLVLENTALKSEVGAHGSAAPAPRRPKRTASAIVSREELEYALSMGRGASRPQRTNTSIPKPD
jgi:hypothetical protein